MYSTTAYLYHQKHRILLIDNSGAYFDRRWQPVYAKNLKINRGVDNVILFEFINQDQKPVNISGSTFTFRVISQNGGALLIAKELVTLSAGAGRAKVTITAEETDGFEAQPAGYSIERSSGVLDEPVFVDAYAGARGFVDIVDSVFPSYRNSSLLTIGAQAPTGNTYYSSTLWTNGQRLTTFQLDTLALNGNLAVQGATTTDDEWYDIPFENLANSATVGNIVFNGTTERLGINVEGYHPYIRLQFGINSGNVEQILYR
jgi:hypothetical protein